MLKECQQHFVIGNPKSQICWLFLKVLGRVWVTKLSHYSLSIWIPKDISKTFHKTSHQRLSIHGSTEIDPVCLKDWKPSIGGNSSQ